MQQPTRPTHPTTLFSFASLARLGAAAACLALAACGGDDPAPAADGTPTLDAAEPMAGGLHVSWTNSRSDCDAIEGERKGGGAEYAAIFSLPGAADNKHDGGPLVVGTSYTYRVRCKRGTTYSAYSNEVSATAAAP